MFRLQIIAGDYAAANERIKSLRDILRASDPVNATVVYTQYGIFSDAKLRQAAGKMITSDISFKTMC